MTRLEQIVSHVKKMPDSLQNEVLDFVEYLEAKNLAKNKHMNNQEWSNFSLKHALSDMKDEQVQYSEFDLKEKF